MTQHRLLAAALAATLVAVVPGIAGAQDPETVTPEGVDWRLTSYLDPDSVELVTVPFGVQPGLLLQEGMASGSAGCNQFSGGYEIDAASLRFDEELTVTLALCEDEVQAIEDTYLAALGAVDGWIIDAGVLELSDDFGDIVLTFEVPTISWTPSQMAALMQTIGGLQTEIATLREEIDTLRADTEALNVGRLRERIKDLEAEDTQVRKRLDALEEQPSSNSRDTGQVSFSKAEKVLLEGIPTRIARTCTPRRSSLPKNTRAAVSCRPNTSAVASVNYYLLEGDDAADAFGDTMATFNVPDASSASETCEQGVKSQRFWLGGGWQAEGCYRTNKRAEVRFVDNATDCRKLKVGSRTLQSPAFYIELQGTNNDVARVHAWATRNLGADASQLTSITRPIERPNAALSPSCPT